MALCDLQEKHIWKRCKKILHEQATKARLDLNQRLQLQQARIFTIRRPSRFRGQRAFALFLDHGRFGNGRNRAVHQSGTLDAFHQRYLQTPSVFVPNRNSERQCFNP